MRFQLRRQIAFAILLGVCCAPSGWAADRTDPITAGESALRDTRPPWYDVNEDAVRVVSIQEESEVGERQDWRDSKPKRPDWIWDWDWDWWWSGSGGGGAGGGFRFPSFGEILQLLGWLLLFVLLGALVYALVRAFLNLEPSEAARKKSLSALAEARTDEQRIRELPMQPTKQKGDFLSMAKSCYEQGKYADAIIYLFSHRLLQLDRAGFIRLTRGKTNRQYLVEASRSPQLRKILGQTIVCFEDVFFGKHELSRDRFEQTWSHNDAFDTIIQRAFD